MSSSAANLPPFRASRVIFTLLGLTTAVGSFAADFFSETHIFNPRWTPHAKFHTGQTLSMSVAIALSTPWILYRPSSVSQSKDEVALFVEEKERLHFAFLVNCFYWVTQASALLYPHTLALDPEFGTGSPQLYIQAFFLLAAGVAYWLGLRELQGLKRAAELKGMGKGKGQ